LTGRAGYAVAGIDGEDRRGVHRTRRERSDPDLVDANAVLTCMNLAVREAGVAANVDDVAPVGKRNPLDGRDSDLRARRRDHDEGEAEHGGKEYRAPHRCSTLGSHSGESSSSFTRPNIAVVLSPKR